jgi:peptidyl-prolyl cis-trans isomerase D
MLRKLHNKKVQKKIWIILLIFILPGFVIWGFSSSVRNAEKQGRGLGKVFNREISQEEYSEATQAMETQLRMQLGDSYSKYQKLFDLNSMALQRLVLLYEADKRRIRISDAELTGFIQKDPSFQRKGAFDVSFYEQIIKYSLHMQPRSYEEMTRKNLKIKKLFDEVTRDLKLNEAQIQEAYRKENEQISVYYISSIPSDFSRDLNPSETELKEYFAKNPLDFKKPLSFNLEYLTLESADQIKDLNDRIEKKESLENIAKESNLAIKTTGLFGETDPIPGIGWSQEISKSLSQFKTGSIFGPIEIEKKFYLFRVKEHKDPFIPDFKDIKEEVQSRFVQARSRELAKEKIEDCAKSIAGLTEKDAKNPDFDKIAKELGLKSATTGLFKFGSYIEGIGASDNFFESANRLKPDAASPVIELPSGFFIIKLKDKTGLDEKKFSEDKAKFTAKLLFDKKQEYFDKFLAELMKKAQS